jgi:hypothetical protein
MINFSRYNGSIVNIEYSIDTYGEFDKFIIIGDNYSFMFTAYGEGNCKSYFREYKDYKFYNLIGKTIEAIHEIAVPDDYNIELIDEEYSNIIPRLYEISFKNDINSFKFIMYNYSSNFDNGWIISSIIE